MRDFILFCCIIAAAVAFPASQDLPTPPAQYNVKNVIEVPIVCPPNYKPDQNGRCREVWRMARVNKDIICPDGQTPHLRGLRCDPIITDVGDKNVIDAPVVCPVGQKPDQNGKCRDQWTMRSETDDKNVIDVPVVCPVGQKPDQNGKCRDTWTMNEVDDRNVIDVPVVCPVGQKPDQNGKCRDQYTMRNGIDTQNVIDVPVVCKDGQKPDKNGKCRDVWQSNGIEVTTGIIYP